MKEEKSKPEYKYAFNKVFTGSYLIYNLGNELINFIKTDNNDSVFSNKRLVYLNPYGKRCQKAADETKYVLHIMETVYDNEKYYELVAISKILEENKDGKKVNKKTLYNTSNTEEERSNYKNANIKFEGLSIGDIFDDSKAHLCSFYAEELLEPEENTHIFFKGNADEKNIKIQNVRQKNDINDIFIVNIKSNLSGCRNLCYSRKNDLDVLDQLVEPKKYLESKNNTINIEDINDEQCFAVLCDRTKLEDSMSNQIAYFLSRKKETLKKFINLLNSKKNKDTKKITWTNKLNFKILREFNNIDLLIESEKDIIVIENKINSSICSYNKNDKKRTKAKYSSDEIFSQLSKYYKFIMEYCKNESNNIKEKHFYILKPDYNPINENELKKHEYGKEYQIITYTELYEALKPRERKNKPSESEFLYDQFIQSLEYVKSSKAEQMRKTAYIRLKQRYNELKEKNPNN